MKRKIYSTIANVLSSLDFTKNKIRENTILLFHSVSEFGSLDIYDMSIKNFENIIKFLKSKYTFAKFDDVLKFENKLIVTFDDGFLNNLKLAIPILEKYDIPSHIFITSDFIKNENNQFLNKNELRELSQIKNVSLGSHGKSHRKLVELDDDTVELEARESKKYIENITSKKINSISYPHGAFDNRVMKIFQKEDYIYGATSIFGSIDEKVDRLKLPRVDIWSNDTNDTIIQKINGSWNFINYINKLKKFKL